MPDDRVPLILSETPVRRLRPFGTLPRPRPGVAVVGASNGHDARTVAGRRTLGEMAFGPESTQYEVDVAEHESRFTFDLKSANEDFTFIVSAHVTWVVHDPSQVARRRILEGSEFVRRHLWDRLSYLGRQYDVEDVQRLERAIREHYEPAAHRLLDYCVRIVSQTVQVSLDAAGTEWLQHLRAARREQALAEQRHQVDLLKRQQAEELAEMEKEHQIMLARKQQDFERDNRRLDEEQTAMLREAEDRRVLALENDRADAFRRAMEQGDAAVLARHLGRHPDDAKEIVRMIVDNKSQAEERQAKLLADMIDKGIILGADLEGVNRDLVRTVMGMVNRSNGGIFSLNTTIDVTSELADRASAVIEAAEKDDGDGKPDV
jgi:hypothetical protein